MEEFIPFQKIARLNREIVITEKIDGTNALIYIDDNFNMYAGSRSRWITAQSDNHGFAKWVDKNKDELIKLGPGRHHGEWFGSGIQRNYGLTEKRFSLFNTGVWNADNTPSCCGIVPVLYQGLAPISEAASSCIEQLKSNGSVAVPGFMNPEGIVIYHTAAGYYFKVTCEKDESPKGRNES